MSSAALAAVEGPLICPGGLPSRGSTEWVGWLTAAHVYSWSCWVENHNNNKKYILIKLIERGCELVLTKLDSSLLAWKNWCEFSFEMSWILGGEIRHSWNPITSLSKVGQHSFAISHLATFGHHHHHHPSNLVYPNNFVLRRRGPEENQRRHVPTCKLQTGSWPLHLCVHLNNLLIHFYWLSGLWGIVGDHASCHGAKTGWHPGQVGSSSQGHIQRQTIIYSKLSTSMDNLEFQIGLTCTCLDCGGKPG